METPDLVNLLQTRLYDRIIRMSYIEEKEKLHEDFQDIDEDLMISHIKAYIIKTYEEIEDDEEKTRFINIVNDPEIEKSRIIDVTIFHILIQNFIKSLNSLKSKIGDRVNRHIIDDLKELEKYKTKDIYKELKKENNKIAQIIKDYHGYVTFNELKEKSHDEPYYVDGYQEYVISEEELKIIEATKKYPIPNQMAHLLFDTRKNCEYHCDHEIKSDKEILKKLLVSTNKCSPRYDIVFDDGTIVCYNEGNIRIRPYNFKQLLRYTKLYLAKNYDTLLDSYENPLNISFDIDSDFFDFGPTIEPTDFESNSDEVARQMIINSFIHAHDMLIDYEDIYTKEIIDESKKELVKVKEITKKYDL